MRVILKTNNGRVVLETTTMDNQEAVDPVGTIWERVELTAEQEIWKSTATGQLARRKTA